jgi:hypothetical protein
MKAPGPAEPKPSGAAGAWKGHELHAGVRQLDFSRLLRPTLPHGHTAPTAETIFKARHRRLRHFRAALLALRGKSRME